MGKALNSGDNALLAERREDGSPRFKPGRKFCPPECPEPLRGYREQKRQTAPSDEDDERRGGRQAETARARTRDGARPYGRLVQCRLWARKRPKNRRQATTRRSKKSKLACPPCLRRHGQRLSEKGGGEFPVPGNEIGVEPLAVLVKFKRKAEYSVSRLHLPEGRL